VVHACRMPACGELCAAIVREAIFMPLPFIEIRRDRHRLSFAHSRSALHFASTE
jgi:hypothetical protein